MTAARVAALDGRALVHVTGADARHFLDRLVTADVDRIADGDGAGYGALLTPQGKILADFLIVRLDDGFLLDGPAEAAGDLVKRLTLYKLRADVRIEDVSDRLAVVAVWGVDAAPAMPGHTVRDPRHPDLGFRAYVPKVAVGAAEGFGGAVIETAAAHAAHRAALGIPEGAADFALGEMFPHDVAMDQLSGVAFDKGCYVGQEVVSRMEHRATARRRPVLVSAEAPLPSTGAEITAGGKPLGSLGTVAGNEGLAIVRLDRAKDAADGGVPILAGGVPVRLTLPAWAHYDWPAGKADD
jgi:folate-binding protein YgfZ